MTAAHLPADDADELSWTLFHQDRVISRRQALRFLTAKAISVRLGSGRWRAPARGVYLTHNGPMTRQQRRWIAVLAVGNPRPALLAGCSALESHGLRGYGRDEIHVLVPAGSQEQIGRAHV